MKSNPTLPSARNLQLDFFRGLALMIIFINHMPGNPWFHYTPSRLGLSDSAETFVFLSGFAAAIAFGRSFRQAGLGLGSVRVFFRCGQIYLAHLALFIMMVAMLLSLNSLSFMHVSWHLDNLGYFFAHTEQALQALVSLKYVPNFIDILPMYLVIMLWLPMVWALSRIHVALAVGYSLALYLAASVYGWELPADPQSNQAWYFNPFCWQLVFFTGFAFSSGWLPVPRPRTDLIALCTAYALFCYPLENAFGYQNLPWFADFRANWEPLLNKSHEGFLRYLHFLAVAYLVYCFMRSRQHWLQSKLAQAVIGMGQQSLPIFMLGTCLSFACGMLLDNFKTDFFGSTLINLAGLGLMILAARLLNWLDQKPWKNAAAAVSRRPSYVWPRQAMLACGLSFVTAAPLLFLQTESAQPDMAMAAQQADEVIALADEAAALETETVAYQPPEPAIDMPNPL